MTMQTADILFISHGGGPLPLLGDVGHQALVSCLQQLASQLNRPKAVIVFSAHWESTPVRVTTSANPSLLYDYYGFPPESYAIQYPCQGEPELAAQILSQLKAQGIDADAETERGLDHGVFVPMKIMYPDADIPCVQVSLRQDLSVEFHLALGKALQGMDLSDVLVLGSGFSFHNMRGFFEPGNQTINQANHAFEQWLEAAMAEANEEAMQRWQQAPGGALSHPREEHLIPLFVCAGLAGRPYDQHLSVDVLGKQASQYLWLASEAPN